MPITWHFKPKRVAATCVPSNLGAGVVDGKCCDKGQAPGKGVCRAVRFYASACASACAFAVACAGVCMLSRVAFVFPGGTRLLLQPSVRTPLSSSAAPPARSASSASSATRGRGSAARQVSRAGPKQQQTLDLRFGARPARRSCSSVQHRSACLAPAGMACT